MAQLPKEKLEQGAEAVLVYRWCPSCQRTYLQGEQRLVDGRQCCAYADCDCSTELDALEWDRIRAVHPQYPRVPLRGQVYPLRCDQPGPDPLAPAAGRPPHHS